MPTTADVDLSPSVVVEGVPLLRAGIAAVLRDQQVAVVAEASSTADAPDLVRGTGAHLLVIGADHDSDLATTIGRVRSGAADVRIVALVPRGSRDALLAVLDAGADAVVPHDAERTELVAAVEAVRLGERHLSSSFTAVLFGRASADDAHVDVPGGCLTARERAVVRLLAEGRTNDEIGERLFISLATVKTHLSNAYDKLGARNRYDAVVKATQLGLL